MAGITVFLKSTLTAFLDRVSPVSSAANPRCMTNTRAVAIIIQRLFTVNISGVVA